MFEYWYPTPLIANFVIREFVLIFFIFSAKEEIVSDELVSIPISFKAEAIEEVALL